MKKKIKKIIGSGFLASQFKKHIKLINKLNIYVYVAGVSNSLCKNKKDFDRDFNRLKNFVGHINNKKLVYISTCSIFDPNRNKSKYIKNKIKIEKFIQDKVISYTIIRLPELVGFNKNKNTLTNFFYNNISNSKNFIAYVNAKRNILDIDDAIKLSFYFLKNSNKKILNIANIQNYSVIDIISEIQNISKISAIYSSKSLKPSVLKITNSINKKILKINKIKIDDKYLYKVIKKYYF
jgi:nucleoside-diphosphate-sugar epimerase